MDRIEFVVAHQELGLGVQLCAEPVINGTNLVTVLKRCDGTSVGYAGLPLDQLLRNLSQSEPSFDAQILRCTCGDDGCSWARAVERCGRTTLSGTTSAQAAPGLLPTAASAPTGSLARNTTGP